MLAEDLQKTDLERLEIRPDDHIERDQVILFFKAPYGWTEVFSAGNISTVIGKAKSRKTFFITLITSGIITNRELQFRSQLTGNVVIFDTEQGKFHVWKVAKRIEALCGVWPDNKLKIFGLRPLNTMERLNEIENYILTKKPQMVFIDGIRDLVTDINSAEQATEVVGKLMKWSHETNCHICNILHQNKADDNARGHIGTEIVNKSETVLSVNKDGDYSGVKSVYTRGKETSEFRFTIDNGLPVVDYQEIIQNNYEPEKDDEVPF